MWHFCPRAQIAARAEGVFHVEKGSGIPNREPHRCVSCKLLEVVEESGLDRFERIATQNPVGVRGILALFQQCRFGADATRAVPL
jgi:hypothetical protein